MEILLNDCTLKEAIEELNYQQMLGYDAYFKGRGNGQVTLVVVDK